MNRIVHTRLTKEERDLTANPIENILVSREGLLKFHFLLFNMPSPYEGGFYHGVLQLNESYPFAPPKLRFFTPSGRFKPSESICTTFTSFHKEEWASAAWTIRNMLIATASFMCGEDGGLGGMVCSSSQRKVFALDSLAWNMKSKDFRNKFQLQLQKQFGKAELAELYRKQSEDQEELEEYYEGFRTVDNDEKKRSQDLRRPIQCGTLLKKKQQRNKRMTYLLSGLLVILVITWLLVR